MNHAGATSSRRTLTTVLAVLLGIAVLCAPAGSASAASAGPQILTADQTGPDNQLVLAMPRAVQAFDSGRGDSVTATWQDIEFPGPMSSISISGSGAGQQSRSITIDHAEQLVVGANDPRGKVHEGSVCGDESPQGSLDVHELERSGSQLVRFSATWDLTGCGIDSGSVRFNSTSSLSALAPQPFALYAPSTEVGGSWTGSIELQNITRAPVSHWTASVTGERAAAWRVADSSDCAPSREVAPGATCRLDVTFDPQVGDPSPALLRVTPDDGPTTFVELTGTGVGRPSPPLAPTAYASALGAVVTWERETNSGGSSDAFATISKTTDGGRTWTVVGRPTGPRELDGTMVRQFSDPSGVAPGARAGYRVQVTKDRVVPGQTTTYTSEPSAIAWADGVRASLLVSGRSSAGEGAGSMSLQSPHLGTFLSYPSIDWSVSPDGRSMVYPTRPGPAGTAYGIKKFSIAGGSLQAGTFIAGLSQLPTDLSWSSQGDRIAFRSDDEHWNTVPVTGGTFTALTGLLADHVTWLADGRTLLATCACSSDNGTLSLNDTMSHQQSLLLDDPLMVATLSPDGRNVATLSPNPDNWSRPIVTTYPFDQNSLRLGSVTGRTVGISGYPASVIDWSPDGRGLLLSGGTSEIWPVTSTGVVAASVAVWSGATTRMSWHTFRPTLAPTSSGGRTTGFAISSGSMAPGTTFSCALDNGPARGCSGSWVAPTLTQGRHTLTVVASEPGGRSATATRTWQVGGVGLYRSVTPKRVMDTRFGTGAPKSKLGPGKTVDLTIPGLPVDTTAVTLNLTATGGSAASYLTLYPADVGRPVTSNLNFTRGQTVANQVVVRVAPGGKVRVFNGAGSSDVIVDLAGYYAIGGGDRFTAVAPTRILDTRRNGPKLGPGDLRGGRYDLPVGLFPSNETVTPSSIVGTLTATQTTASGYLTVFGGGQNQPAVSSLNFGPGQTVANAVNVAVNPYYTVGNSSGSTHVLMDVAGFFEARHGAGYVAVAPARVLDTRQGLGAPRARVGPASTTLTIPGLPPGTTSVVLNLTAVGPNASSYVTSWPADRARPVASVLNYRPGQTVAGLTTVAVDRKGRVNLAVGAGSADLIADLAGYYAF